MTKLNETEISRAIMTAYHEKLADRVVSDVLIAGSGPAGMTAALYLQKGGYKVTIVEKRLSPGGGVWGGGMAMNEVVVQETGLAILDEVGVRRRHAGGALYVADAMELASGLCFKALQAGAVILNLTTAEDVVVHDGRVTGLVVNRSMIGEALPIDPLTFAARAVLDATGHEAAVVERLKKRGLLDETGVEGPMDATVGEEFVAERVAEVYPGLWVAGMSVCATLGGPRMGPIFGGMLLSGKSAADRIAAAL